MNRSDKNPSILIVDDVPHNLQILARILSAENYNIIGAVNGMQALMTAEQENPDLILLDVMMPEMGGYETCRRLKASSKTRNIPVIFLTAKVNTEDVVKGFEIGAVDYITKPFNSTELLARVSAHLEIKFSREKIQEQSNERKELIHILCHDLKNPVGSLKVVLDLIFTDPTLLEEMKEAILISTDNCLNIIDLVRDIMVMDSDRQNIPLDSYEVKQMLDEAITIVSQKLEKKNITITQRIEPGLKALVEKTSFINSVLNNLFSNSIKFSYPDSKIEIKAWKEGEESIISVRDHGMGMPDNVLENLFHPSNSISRVGTDGETGTGFGMPLVKKFVTAYGGTIDVHSKEQSDNSTDHGTTITIKVKSEKQRNR